MNQTKLEELISKWENNFKKVDGPGLPLEEWSAYWAINEFIKDLKSLQSEQEVEKIKKIEEPVIIEDGCARNLLPIERKVNEIIDRLNLYIK